MPTWFADEKPSSVGVGGNCCCTARYVALTFGSVVGTPVSTDRVELICAKVLTPISATTGPGAGAGMVGDASTTTLVWLPSTSKVRKNWSAKGPACKPMTVPILDKTAPWDV